MMSSLQTTLHFSVAHHPRTMRKLSPERDLLPSPAGLLEVCVARCEERPEGTNPIRNWPLSICVPGSGVWPPQFLPAQYPFRAPLIPHATSYPPVRGPYDMLSPPLGQYILDYEPPHEFVIPSFAMYDGSSDPYDHM